jgi:hypothetical protein
LSGIRQRKLYRCSTPEGMGAGKAPLRFSRRFALKTVLNARRHRSGEN